jgi:ABC-type phosphate/phosphonate transport system substrate-binding protein
MTGGHRLSARAVAEGRADIAALDAVTHMLLLDSDPDISGLRVIAATDPTPGLPFITAPGGPAEALFRAIERAIPALSPEDRRTLHLKGILRIPSEAYLAVPNPPAPDTFAPSD